MNMDELRKVAETLDRDELICCLVSVEMDRDTLKEENEKLKKENEKLKALAALGAEGILKFHGVS